MVTNKISVTDVQAESCDSDSCSIKEALPINGESGKHHRALFGRSRSLTVQLVKEFDSPVCATRGFCSKCGTRLI